MPIKKLSPTEIKDTVEKIRKKYDEYAFKYFKSAQHKKNFEDRYLGALRGGVDISSFLIAEIGAIMELVKREEDKVLEKRPPRPAAAQGPGFADRIIEENRKRIEKYSAPEVHPDAPDEIRRLFGALNRLEREFWPGLYAPLRNTSFSLNTKTMIGLENQLHQIAGRINDGISSRLERYVARLKRFPRDYGLIEKDEKDYLLEAAFLLHELVDILTTALRKHETVFTTEEKNTLNEILAYCDGVLADFRLKELKRR
jgi:hypothetical protein